MTLQDKLKEFDERFSQTPLTATACKDCGTIGIGKWNHMKACETRDRPEHDIRLFFTKVWHSAQQARDEDVGEMVEEMRTFPAEMFQIHNGKMPFVVFEGKADEGEKYQLFRLGFQDALSQVKHKILARLSESKEK
jgi:hypothetical protein